MDALQGNGNGNSNGQNRGSATSMSKFEHLRDLLRRMDSNVEIARNIRLGRVMVEPSSASHAESFPIAAAKMNSVTGKPRAIARSLGDFEAAFARLADRQAG